MITRSTEKSDVVATAIWVFYLVATCVICYIAIRHLLLTNGWLNPAALGCRKFVPALCSCVLHVTKIQAFTRPLEPIQYGETNLKRMHYATFAVLYAYMFNNINMLVSYASLLEWLPFGYGQTAITVSALFYLCAKTAMYFVYVGRLKSAFKNTFSGYSDRVINMLYSLVVGFALAMCALIGFVASEKRNYRYAKSEMALRIAYGFLIYDSVFTFLVVYLFYRALGRVLTQCTDVGNARAVADTRNRTPELYLMPLKYTVISCVAVFTTMFSLAILVVFGEGVFMPVDSVVNCLSVVLMSKSWAPSYIFCCNPALRCVANTSCLCADAAEAQLVDLVVQTTTIEVIDARATPAPVPVQNPTAVTTLAPTIPTQVPALVTVRSNDSSSDAR